MKFSIGYNEQESFFDLLEQYGEHISSVYFAPPNFIIPSGRSIVQNDDYEEQIKKLIRVCNKYGIGTILTMNATCEHEKTGDKEHMLQLINYIKKLKEVGLSSLSLTNLLYVRFIKKSISDLHIYSSVNCYVKTTEQALYMKKIGVDIITIDRDINRDLGLIKKIKEKTGLPIQIMLNEGCIRNCPFRNTHFNIIAHQTEDNLRNEKIGKYNLIERFSCTPLLSENKKLIFRIPFVRPEDLHHYEGLCDYFKLVTRGLPTEKIELFLKAYTDGFYHGNLFDIIDMSIIDYQLIIDYVDNDRLTELDFFQDIQKCPGDCDMCFNCDKYL